MAKFKKMWMFLLVLLMVGAFSQAGAQSQPYQLEETPKYVGSSAFDTVLLTGLSTSSKSGIITNEGPAKLIIYFTKRGTYTIDTNAYFLLDTGRTLKFTTNGRAILRKAEDDSCYSQVLMGGVELMDNSGSSSGTLFAEYTPYSKYWEAERLSCFKMPQWSGNAGGTTVAGAEAVAVRAECVYIYRECVYIYRN